jgi:2-keto-4-pentenoate hydratase/2-oxohepta-3-ene-1,7-dioic acid hydratase in catechol pathway
MMTAADGLTAPFALVRVATGDRPDGAPGAEAELGLVVRDRLHILTLEELGAPDLNGFLAAPDWDRLALLAAGDLHGPGWSSVDDAQLLAPVQPRQVLQTGANYRSHVIDLVVAGLAADDPRTPEEARAWAGAMMDERQAHGDPYFFIGLPACVVSPVEPLVLPRYSDRHDWELELAVVIGAEAFRVSREGALDHVAGYTIVNDITTRDLVFRKDMKEIGTDWYRAKNAPGFLPTGPFLVPSRFVDPSQLHVQLELNGTTMQDASTSDLLFDVAALVAGASQTARLLPGDLLLTGSPAGNGAHWGRLLRDGDVMTGTIQGLGVQTVRCVAEGPE